MKTRQGFVSNSSSSSFVVCKQLVGSEAFNKIKEILNEISSEFGYDDETGCWFDSNPNYISGRVSHHVDFDEKLDELKLEKDSYIFGD